MFLLDFSVDNERYAEEEGQSDDDHKHLHILIVSLPAYQIPTQLASSCLLLEKNLQSRRSICVSRRPK